MRTAILSLLAAASIVSAQVTTGLAVSEFSDGQPQAFTTAPCTETTPIVSLTTPIVPTTHINSSTPTPSSSFPVSPISNSRTRTRTTRTTLISTAYNITSLRPTAYSTRSPSPSSSIVSPISGSPSMNCSTPRVSSSVVSPISGSPTRSRPIGTTPISPISPPPTITSTPTPTCNCTISQTSSSQAGALSNSSQKPRTYPTSYITHTTPAVSSPIVGPTVAPIANVAAGGESKIAVVVVAALVGAASFLI